MKVVIALLLLLAITQAYRKAGDPIVRTGPELEKYLAGDLQGTFILFFYKSTAPSRRTSAVRSEVKSKILDKNPNFHYYELDIDSGSFNDVVEEMKVDVTELKHSPTIMVASEGIGYWSHGEGAVDDIVNHLSDYSGELRRRK